MNLIPYEEKHAGHRPNSCPFCDSFQQSCNMMLNEFNRYVANIHCLSCEAFGPMSIPHDTPEGAEADARTRWNGDASTGTTKAADVAENRGDGDRVSRPHA